MRRNELVALLCCLACACGGDDEPPGGTGGTDGGIVVDTDAGRTADAGVGADATIDPGLGDLWIDTDGGTCTRHGEPGEYVDEEACATMDEAYAAANCGDTIRVKDGTYPEQQIFETAAGSACVGSPIIFRPEAGSRPTFQHIRLGEFVGNPADNSPDNITMVGFAVVWGIDIEHDAEHIVVDDFTGGSFAMGGSDGGGPPDDITIRNSEWGPCNSGGAEGQDCRNQYDSDPHNGQNKIVDGVSNVLIENNVIHDFTLEDPDHFECIWSNGGNNVTLRNNWIYNCVTNGIALDANGMSGTWTFENNWWGQVSDGNAALKWGLRDTCPDGDVIIRYNSFAARSSVGNEDGGSANCPNIWVIGNILGQRASCEAGARYFYNLYLDGSTCGGEGEATIASLPYVDASGLASGDYHLSGPSMADDYVPDTVMHSDLSTDRDGETRSAPRDVGADEH